MSKIDLETLAKEYAAGRISREDFLYLHQMLTQQAQQRQGNRKPVQRPPVQPAARRPAMNPNVHNQPRIQGNYVQAAQPAGSGSVFGYVRRHHKEVVALLGTIGIFLSMYYNKIDTKPQETPGARVVVLQSDNAKKPARLRTEDVKLIAELITEDNNWSRELTNDFVNQWDKLTLNEKVKIKQEDWYYKFSTMLSKQINNTRKKADEGDISAIYNQQALLEIADKLIFDDNPDAKKILAALNGVQREKQKSSPAPVEKAVKTDKVKPQRNPVIKEKIAKIDNNTKRENSKSGKKHTISEKELKSVLKDFKFAFKAGNTKTLIQLFASDEYSTSFTSLDAIKDDYRSMFRNTRERSLALDALDWEHDYDEARGKGLYQAKIRLRHNNVLKTITADLDITVRRIFGKLQITDFKLRNKEIVTSTTNFKKSLKKRLANNKDKPKFPTQAELQDLVTQYVTAYETGDVDQMVSLFSGGTWKAGRNAKLVMKQDYRDLFRNTKDREVYVKDIKWKFKKDKALGTGELILTSHSLDNNKTTTKKGKIRIVAKRLNNDKVQFTQVFHVLD